MNIFICDDDKNIGDRFSHMLTEHYGNKIKLQCFTDYDSMLSYIGSGTAVEPDIVISDIMVGDKNGCFEAGEISKSFPFARIIFLTGYPELVADIFARVKPSNILLKPVTPERLIDAVDKAYEEYQSDMGKRTYKIKNQKSELIFRYYDIIFAESNGRRLNLHTSSEDFVFYHKLSDFLDETNGYFIRCHQSYAVNPYRVKALHAAEALMDDGSTVGVSRAYYAALRDALLDIS